jgi:hypothetical protein
MGVKEAGGIKECQTESEVVFVHGFKERGWSLATIPHISP